MKVFDSHGREIELITPLLDSGRDTLQWSLRPVVQQLRDDSRKDY